MKSHTLQLYSPARLTVYAAPPTICSRFEKHCGSRAKKWRTSLRVEEEGTAGEVPMTVGHWLAIRGIHIKVRGWGGLGWGVLVGGWVGAGG